MLTSAITVNQVELLHHTLGVNPERRQPYRNHFVAGRGHHDLPVLEALEAAGLMIRGTTPGFLPDSDTVFHVTDAGRAYALENLRRLRPRQNVRSIGTTSISANATTRSASSLVSKPPTSRRGRNTEGIGRITSGFASTGCIAATVGRATAAT